MHNAVAVESNRKFYIIGRKKQAKILLIENLNFEEKKVEIDYAQSKFDQKISLTEVNISKLQDEEFLYLENDIKIINDLRVKFIKI